MDIRVSEDIAWLCDVRLSGGEEGFEADLQDRSREDMERLLGEAIDALLDAEDQHKREIRRITERFTKPS